MVATGLQLLGIAGSTRAASLNRALLRTVGELLPADAKLTLWDGLETLPIFNTDVEEPHAVLSLKSAIARADGVIISVPEYNYSIPGGLKNALDWVSRPPATSPMRGKPTAICGAASGMSGTIRAQNHLRAMLVYSDTPVMNQPEVLIPRAHERFDQTGTLTDESTRQLLIRFATAVTAFVRKHRP